MPPAPSLSDAVAEELLQLKKTREDARELIFVARLLSAITQKTRQRNQALRHRLEEQFRRLSSLLRRAH